MNKVVTQVDVGCHGAVGLNLAHQVPDGYGNIVGRPGQDLVRPDPLGNKFGHRAVVATGLRTCVVVVVVVVVIIIIISTGKGKSYLLLHTRSRA
jgi:hypothetical protein